MITPPRNRFSRPASLLLAGACLWLGLLAGASAQLTSEAMSRAQKQIAALQQDKDSRTPAQNKMDANLIRAAREAQGRPAHPAAPLLHSGVVMKADKTVELDLTGAITAKLLDAIKAAGGRIVNSHPEANAARIFLPVGVIESIAGRDDVKFIKPAVRVEYSTGSVDSEGDTTHEAIQARSTYNVAGAGITVGVISNSDNDSSNALAAAFNTGDLDPNNTYVIQGQDGSSSEDGEGLAMMEVVHDIAPDAVIIFATADGGEAQTASNIKALEANGCNVIIDDITFGDESPFQDGVVSQAVSTVSADGVLYFSSARNSGNFDQGTPSVWEGDFLDGGDASGFDGHAGARYHLFTAANGSTGIENPTINNGQSGSITLFWSDPLGGASDDYDVYELNSSGDVVAAGDNRQTGTQDPIEDTNQAIVPGDYVGIIKYSGAARFLHVEVGRLEIYAGTNGCVRGHNASTAANAFSVAATPAHGAFESGQPVGPYPNAFNSSNQTETFSSDGPRRMFYMADGTPYTAGNFSSTGGKVFAKPDFTAADGVMTTLPSNSGLNPFYGTSCAAPHAGSIAALLLSSDPSMTPAEAGAALRAGVVVPESSLGETKNDYGAGILLAPKVLAAAASASPPSITSATTASATVGTAFSYTITASNSPTSYNATGLPSGLSVNKTTGVISGTPAASSVGTKTLHLTATNSAGSGTATLTLTIKAASVSPPVITSSATASATVGVSFSYQITASNSPTSYNATGLPSGLSVNKTTGLISGTPASTSAGTKTLHLSAINSAGTGTLTLTLTIKAASAKPPVITSSATASATTGKAFSYQIIATNSPTSYNATGLPSGLSVNKTTGLISGTPASTASGTKTLNLSAINSAGTGTETLTLTIAK